MRHATASIPWPLFNSACSNSWNFFSSFSPSLSDMNRSIDFLQHYLWLWFVRYEWAIRFFDVRKIKRTDSHRLILLRITSKFTLTVDAFTYTDREAQGNARQILAAWGSTRLLTTWRVLNVPSSRDTIPSQRFQWFEVFAFVATRQLDLLPFSSSSSSCSVSQHHCSVLLFIRIISSTSFLIFSFLFTLSFLFSYSISCSSSSRSFVLFFFFLFFFFLLFIFTWSRGSCGSSRYDYIVLPILLLILRYVWYLTRRYHTLLAFLDCVHTSTRNVQLKIYWPSEHANASPLEDPFLQEPFEISNRSTHIDITFRKLLGKQRGGRGKKFALLNASVTIFSALVILFSSIAALASMMIFFISRSFDERMRVLFYIHLWSSRNVPVFMYELSLDYAFYFWWIQRVMNDWYILKLNATLEC